MIKFNGFILGLALLGLLGCGSKDVSLDGDGSPGDGDGSIGDGDGGLEDAYVFADADPNAPDAGAGGCISGGPQCSNCIDDDGDGDIDGFDVECTGAIDNDEATFATGIPGDNKDSKTQDCFYDGDSGGGNDGCAFHTCCLLTVCPPDLAGQFDPAECSTTLTQECINNCAPLAPPGCDCFGCCTICDSVGCVDVYTNPAIAPNCDAASIRDPALCPTCTPNTACGTPCDPAQCILCPGQDPSDLPSSCTTNSCPSGQTTCTTATDCTADEYCSQGCCIGSIIVQ